MIFPEAGSHGEARTEPTVELFIIVLEQKSRAHNGSCDFACSLPSRLPDIRSGSGEPVTKHGEKSLFNKVLGFIGSMSLQVYLLHGMLTIVIVERTPLLRIPNMTVWIAVTLAATFFAAFVLKTICDLIRKVFNKAK